MQRPTTLVRALGASLTCTRREEPPTVARNIASRRARLVVVLLLVLVPRAGWAQGSRFCDDAESAPKWRT